MVENLLLDIVSLCLAIDKTAYQIYKTLAAIEQRKELKAFWTELSLREKVPAKYWEKLLYFAEKGIMPQVFDDPFKVKEELERINTEASMLLETAKKPPGFSDSFLLAYNLEFYLLHPAFVLLFHFMKTLPESETPENNYEEHIDGFINTVSKYKTVTPELDLVGKIIRRLWCDNKLLTSLSTTDDLTKLLNRRGLFNAVNVLANLAKRNGYDIGIMMLDVDCFKAINDTHGHQKGDQVLQQVAGILKNNIRSSDIIGRYGGDEFLVFLSPVDLRFLPKIAEKICNRVETGTKEDLPVTISIGVSRGLVTTDVKAEVDVLIRKADEALYKAKSSGRNRTIVCDS